MALPAGLKVHYRVDQVVGVSDGDPAPATLTDESGNGFTATLGGSETARTWYRATATPLGTPSIELEGSAALGRNAGYSFGSLAGLTEASVFMVLKRKPESINVGPWRLNNGDGSYHSYSDGNTYEAAFSDGGRAVFPVTAVSTWMIYHVAVGGGTRTIYVDNTQIATGAATFAAPTAPSVGRVVSNGNDEGWNGELAEFLIFDSVLSAADRQAVVDELSARHLIAPPSNVLSVTLPALSANLSGTSTPPPVTGSLAATLPALTFTGSGGSSSGVITGTLAATLPALTASLSGTAPAPSGVAGTLNAQLPALNALLAGSLGYADTSLTYSDDGYGYDGTARVVYDPPVAAEPAGIQRVKVRRVHQSLPAPTLVNGRST